MQGDSNKQNERMAGAAASYRRVLTDTPFLLLWMGVTLSYLTDRVLQLGMLELVRPTVDNLAAVNNDLLLFFMLPFVFLSPLAGPLIDRRSRRAILALMATGKATTVVLFVVLLSTAAGLSNSLLFVYAMVALHGSLTVFFSPARTSLVPQLVEHRDLMAANSLMNVTSMFMMLLGSFVAAGLLALIGRGVLTLRTSFLLLAMVYLVAVSLFWRMRISATAMRAAQSSHEGYLERLRGGLRYAATHRVAWRLIGLAASFWLVAGLIYTAVGGKLLNDMELGTDEFGYAQGVLGFAMFVGGLLITFTFRWLPSIGVAVRGAFLIVGLSVLSLIWPDRFALLLVPIALIGLTGGALLVLIVTLIHRTVPRRTHGRMFSLVETCQNTAFIGALIGGRIALDHLPVQTICWAIGVICLLPVVLGAIFIRRTQTA